MQLDATHDPRRRSWVASANEPDTDFPLQNLPFGSFRPRGGAARGGVAIGDHIVDLAALATAGLLTGTAGEAATAAADGALNRLMALGQPHWSALRQALSQRLGADGTEAPRHRATLEPLLVPMAEAEILLPARVGDYSDFLTSIYHATNAGAFTRPDGPLPPNYKYVPIGYHGRASTVLPSGTPIHRPKGQRPNAGGAPGYGPSQALDYEAEMAIHLGPGTALGETLAVDEARRRIFGFTILNDWSARDIQFWESQPLGPFLGKSFATSISPWIVTQEALLPFRTHAFHRDAGDPAPLPYLSSATESEVGGLDVAIEVRLHTAQMRAAGEKPVRLSLGNLRDSYWTAAQLVTHHASNGCRLAAGDVMGTGTMSGATPDSLGCFLELTHRGTKPLRLPNGEERGFLMDGDEVIMQARCRREGYVGIGFGECRGRVEAAL